MNVYVLPVNESLRILVSFDSLKAPEAFLSPLDRAYITFPRVVRDKLMFFSS